MSGIRTGFRIASSMRPRGSRASIHQTENDRLNLSGLAIDLEFVGTALFSGEGAEVRYKAQNGNTLVLADTDGDKSADFAVLLTGVVALDAGDFIL